MIYTDVEKRCTMNTPIDRRKLLQITGSVGITGMIAGCTNSENTPNTENETTENNTSETTSNGSESRQEETVENQDSVQENGAINLQIDSEFNTNNCGVKITSPPGDSFDNVVNNTYYMSSDGELSVPHIRDSQPYTVNVLFIGSIEDQTDGENSSPVLFPLASRQTITEGTNNLGEITIENGTQYQLQLVNAEGEPSTNREFSLRSDNGIGREIYTNESGYVTIEENGERGVNLPPEYVSVTVDEIRNGESISYGEITRPENGSEIIKELIEETEQ